MDKARILVVEDDLNLLEGVRTVLEIDGYQVAVAENGQQALDLLNEYAYHGNVDMPELIVSDIMMPQMDGVEFLRRVRQQQEWVHIPFIFLTARGEKADVQRGKQLGVDDYLIKPFDPQDLLIAVESRLNRHRAMGAVHHSEMSEVKRRILTILNHEFRTPLTFVVAYADMLNEHEHSRLSDDEMLTFLHGVSTGAVRLRRLIENFITLVEFEMGEAERNFALRKTRLSNYDHLFQAVRAAVSVDDRSNPVDVQVEPGLPAVTADPVYLQLALTQLLENAIKFSNTDQTVVLRAAHDGDAVALSVTDHGRGIAETELDRIWDSFYQINRSEYEDQGSGSGLAIVSKIVRLHGGQIDVQSALGQGSVFTIRLPA